MENLKRNLPFLLLIILEVVVGIFLFRDPEGFTRAVIILVGIGFLLAGVVFLVRYLRGRKNGNAGSGTLVGAIVSLILGVICVFASGAIITLIAAFAILYGIILILGGIAKIQSFAGMRSVGLKGPGTVLLLISAIVMLVFGVILLFRPVDTIAVLLQVAGILLIIEAVIDLISLIFFIKDAPREVR